MPALATPHGAGADHRRPLDLVSLDAGDVRHFGGFTLGEEDVALGPGLVARDQLKKRIPFAPERIGDRQRNGGAQCGDGGEWRLLAFGALGVVRSGCIERSEITRAC